MRRFQKFGQFGVVPFALVVSCWVAAPPTEAVDREESAAQTARQGALVDVSADSQVAVLLDEFPAGPQRDAAAAYALVQGDAFWKERASHQVRLMFYRMVFRGAYYPSDWANSSKKRGPLPLTPKSVWEIKLGGAARRVNNNGHDMVVRPYRYHSMIVTSADSIGQSEPNLAAVGGTWDEAFNLPSDPEQLLERTGFACMDEDEYPPNSVHSYNTYYFYDDTCRQEPPTSASCHITQFPQESCVVALQKHTGIEKISLHFARVEYDRAVADRYRVGQITNTNGADLEVVQDDIENEHALFYQFFPPDSCELEEGVIGTLGWRHLLAFSATVRNNGTKAIHIGRVGDPTNPWVTSKVFEFSACHGHYHFSHYGDFRYNGAPGSKRAFCLEETNRFHNDETTPVTATHQSCDYQGIGPGWGDEYEWGIPGQWVDVTHVESSTPLPLTFDANVDQFMCEGRTLDANGQQVEPEDLAHVAFVPSPFTTADGEAISRISCEFPPTWNANNSGTASYSTTPGTSFATEPCAHGEIGPTRNCGFGLSGPITLTFNERVRIRNSSALRAPVVVRVCEVSERLNTGVACAYGDAIVNIIVDVPGGDVEFQSPLVRDAAVPGTRGYSIYTAPLLPGAGAAAVTWSAY